jgi:hypothetical protein
MTFGAFYAETNPGIAVGQSPQSGIVAAVRMAREFVDLFRGKRRFRERWVGD